MKQGFTGFFSVAILTVIGAYTAYAFGALPLPDKLLGIDKFRKLFPAICLGLIAIFGTLLVLLNARKELKQQKQRAKRPDVGKVIQLQGAQKLSDNAAPSLGSASLSNRFEQLTQHVKEEEDLPLSMRNQMHALLPPVKQKSIVSHTSEEEEAIEHVVHSTFSHADSVSLPDLMEEVHAYGHFVSKLVKESEARVRHIESQMSTHLIAADGEFSENLVDAKRILTALRIRIERLTELSSNASPSNLLKAKRLSEELLTVPGDSVHALLTAGELPSLMKEEIEPALNTLLTKAELALSKPYAKLVSNS